MTSRRKIIGFMALVLALFIGMLDSTITNIALPDIVNSFRANLNDVSWISTIYVMGFGVFMITAAKLADQFGRKKCMMIGLCIFGISSAMCGLSQSLIFLIVMRFIQSIGGAMISPTILPMGLALFGKAKIRIITSITGAVTALAAAGGPALGGVIIQYIGWRGIFYVNIPLIVIALTTVAICIKETYDNTVSKKVDFLGVVLLTATLFLLIFAFLKGQYYGWNSGLIVSMFVGSAAAFVLFILTEKKVKFPMLELGLFRESTFSASDFCYMMTGFSLVCPAVILNYFLQNILNYTALNAAFIIMWTSVTVVISMPLGNLLAAKIGSAKPINVLGNLIMGIGILLLSRLTVSTPRSTMIFDVVICGFGMGFACQAIVTAVKFLPVQKSGMASGIINSMRQIGMCIGIALLVSILDVNISNAKANIKTDAITSFDHSTVTESVQTVATKDLSLILNSNDTSEQKKLHTKMQNDIENSLAGAVKTNEIHKGALPKQIVEIQNVMGKIIADKQQKIADSFDGVFFIAAIILISTCFLGIFTDRKKNV
ncbi:MFS transporter [Ethanoligenens sp.]|uniref:MFS transporter n=1 Tax=Ethanoligenens sp. TaxID=2099655 RepID=UPI0039EA0FE5